MKTVEGAEFNIRVLVGAEKRKHILHKITDRKSRETKRPGPIAGRSGIGIQGNFNKLFLFLFFFFLKGDCLFF